MINDIFMVFQCTVAHTRIINQNQCHAVHGKFVKSKHNIFIFSLFLEWWELPTNRPYRPKAQSITNLKSQQKTFWLLKKIFSAKLCAQVYATDSTSLLIFSFSFFLSSFFFFAFNRRTLLYKKILRTTQHNFGKIVNTGTYDIWAYISQKKKAFPLIIGLLNRLSTSVW
jgi:hypothetical protein